MGNPGHVGVVAQLAGGTGPGRHRRGSARRDGARGARSRSGQNAALVVVGSRGHGAFAGMLLGSVGFHLASHAHCPVVIVREAPHELGFDPA